MSYIEENLILGEILAHKTRLHWWSMIRVSIRATIISFIILGILALSTGTGIWFILLPFMILIPGLSGLMRYLTTEIGITDRRILGKKGVIRRKITDLTIDKIETVEVEETIIGRLLGFQTLVIVGTGGTNTEFEMIPNAKRFRMAFIAESTGHIARDKERLDVQKQMLDMQSMQAQVQVEQLRLQQGQYRPNIQVTNPNVIEAQVRPALPAQSSSKLLKQSYAMAKSGDRQGAVRIVKGLMKQDPDNPNVRNLVGLLANSHEQKRRFFQRAVSIEPAHTKARQQLQRL
ncbi:MAG: PH domain-containing protein [Chloroflexota bacterium]